MSSLLIFFILFLKCWTCTRGNIYESGEVVFQNVFRWNYTYMNPTCIDHTGGRNPCQDVRICRFATASLALGGWPTLCDWVGKGVPKVCCGLPLVLGSGLMKKVDEEISRKRECGTRIHSVGLSETQNLFFQILNSLPEVDISDPDKFDPPLDLERKAILIAPVSFKGSRQGDFPWMVSIRMDGTHVCGGSLISRQHILTAARCVLGNSNQYSVHVGNLYVDDGFMFPVSKISVHSGYQIGYSNNLAILTLSEEILSPYFPHVCLPEVDFIEENLQGHLTDEDFQINATDEDLEEHARLLRWGKITLNGTSRQVLRIIDDLTIVPMEQCQRIYANEIFLEELDDFICTNRNQSEEFPCEEEFGGPLMHMHNYPNQMDLTAPWTMIGVDTFGSMCESKSNLRLYTRVSRHLNWILDIVNKRFLA